MGRLGRFAVLGTIVAVALLTSVAASGNRSASAVITAPPAFTNAQLAAPSGNDWISANGNDRSWRYSALSQINGSNGSNLKLAWSANLPVPTPPAGKIETKGQAGGNPLVYKGIVYHDDAWGRIVALDGTNGNLLWTFDPQTGGGGGRGLVALGGGMAFTTQRGVMYGIDAKTGTQKWATQVVDPNGSGEGTIDSAPVYYNGLVIGGTTGGDSGGVCITFALDAQTGKVKWYYNNIPSSPKQEGWDTWPTKRSFFGGGAIWDPVTVDPQRGLVYAGISNALPFSGLLSGPGKELNTESVLALHAMTGKFAWVFQEIHHDIWDYDAMQTPIVADIKVGGKTVTVVNHMNKNTYNFVLNADSGVPVVGVKETPVPQNASQHTWPTQPIPIGDDVVPHVPTTPQAWQGLAPDGKPYIISTVPYTPYDDKGFTVVAPTYTGGIEWPENSFSPRTGLVYVCANVTEFAYSSPPPADIHVLGGSLGLLAIRTSSSASSARISRVVGLDPSTNKVVWKHDDNGLTCSSQVASTAGGLVLISRGDGTILAYDDKTGALDWTLNTGSTTIPRFSFYGVNGKEYLVTTGTTAGANGAVLVNAYTVG